MDPWLASYVAVAVFAVLIVYWVMRRAGQRPAGFVSLAGLGAVLLFLGLYFFPLGAIEAYDATRSWFGWDAKKNGIAWYVGTTLLVVAGVFLLIGPRRVMRG